MNNSEVIPEKNASPEADNPDVKKSEEKKKLLKGTYRRFIKLTSILVTVAAVSVLVAVYLLPAFRVYGNSMTPTISEGNIVIAVSTKDIETGDLVGFYYGNKLLVKRCIAGPGDTVNIDKDGNVYVNDKLLDEPYVKEKSLGQCNIEMPFEVPEGRWFFMGDHRATSVDSRNTAIGVVSSEQIKGKIIFRVWPLDEFGKVS